MEKLAALCCLWDFGLGTKEDYFTELDRLFLENPEDDFLLELEGLGGDCAAAWARMNHPTNVDEFGKELFAALEKIYNENRLSLAKFGELCHEMWLGLTADFWDDEPFYSLSYAYLPLDEYFDEKQTRELYQKAFDYYKEKPMKIFIDYSNEQDKVSPPEDFEKLVEDCTRAALLEEEIAEDAEVSVTLVDNARIREMNAEFREIDRETDVLSFPLGDDEGFEVDPDTDAILLGDIVISLERAAAQAEEYGHCFRREVAFLLMHSLFHLLGYDHMTPEEETEMFAKQEKVLEKLGITR